MRIVEKLTTELISISTAKITRKTKLPLEMCKGTEKERNALAAKYTKELMVGLDAISHKKLCYVTDFINLINKIVAPAKINFEIKPLEGKFNIFSMIQGAMGVKINYDKRLVTDKKGVYYSILDRSIDGYKFLLHLSKNEKFIKDKYAALHEARHLFDHICNPKTIMPRFVTLRTAQTKIEAYNKAHDSFLSDISSCKKIHKKTTKLLSILSNEEAVNCLQSIRSSLKTEINAYKDSVDYLSQSPLKNIVQLEATYEFLLTHNYKKRLKLANEMLAQYLSKARNEIRAIHKK